ncbi:HIT family protein [Chryseomicrobium sp. FSL W7-1435]|uniref:HIT family protein n=1 Tax=Chryseomicrobium sp. FSL W7-1435 TaxID=2921704 RepID=UPI00315AC4EC
MTNCLFCKLISGEIPSTKIYEDQDVFVFMDIMPLTKGHILVIPKEHKESVYDLSEEQAANLFRVVPKLANALKETFHPAGMNLLNNNGAPAGQSVFHFHLHLIPRYDETDGFKATWRTKEKEFTLDKIQQLATELSEKI